MSSDYLESLFGLAGKVSVITGGGGVLCSAMGVALARVGVKVAVLDLAPESAHKAAAEIQTCGARALALSCDAHDRGSIEAAAQAVVKEFGRVDILIIGVGGDKKQATTSPELSFFDLPPESLRWVFDLNCLGTILPSQVFWKIMAALEELAFSISPR
jgi:NAD(P)-dependent dehydrogenase (short-subunit alcohol dehydrogenase family)